ncbi:MAG TPA: DNA internalization-related competence protein ComEC/Rec2, partial [Bacteroidota bacterium]|nr:DNA internalization-related competence protein ComEC/Rec2 [Bacteroidota bacterium]
ELRNAFVNAGIMHVLAIAGLHVGFAALILYSIFSFIGFRKEWAASFTILGLIYCAFLSGGHIPVIRAVTMAAIFVGARIFERKVDLYQVLAVAASVLLLWRPIMFFDAGFQLSFAAVGGLVYLIPKFESWIEGLPERFRSNVFSRIVLISMAVSLAATIATLPLTAYYFQKVSIVGIVVNLAAVPLLCLLMLEGLITIFAAALNMWLGSVFAALTNALCQAMIGLATWGGNLRNGYADIHLGVWMVLWLYATIFLIFELQREGQWRKSVAGVLLASVLGLCIIRWSPTAPRMRVTFLDIGQGDATFIQFSNEKNMLIDAGPLTTHSDAGERFIAPFLEHQRIYRINTLVVSHPHSDHIGGMPYLLRHFTVDRVIDAGVLTQSEIANDYRHLIDSLHLLHQVLAAGATLGGFDPAIITVFHPSGEFLPSDTTAHENLNNQSLVLKITYGANSILLTGDAEVSAENQMEKLDSMGLSANVLKVGHHGSDNASSLSFLHFVHPSIAVISCGRNNKFSHPSPVTIADLAAIGCTTFRTDQEGAVVLESDGRVWRVVSWRDAY